MSTRAAYNIEQLHFLVVDDNMHMSMLIKNLLHALGSRQVVEANAAADAFAELTHFPADIIITDYHMQPLDGLDFVRLVRTGSDSPNPFVPIIMLSGHTEMRKTMQARDAGP
jgi:two-component system chemotaxis response regulator CheY